MSAAPTHRLRQQVHLLPQTLILFLHPYENVFRSVARVLRIRLEGIGRFSGRGDREDAGLLRSASEAGNDVRAGRPHRRTRGYNRSHGPTPIKSVWLGLHKDPSSRSRQSSRRCGNGSSVVGSVPSATAAPRWFWNLIRVHRMMRVPAVPAATSTRLVPESSRAEVHEHAYMQSKLCGSQRQTQVCLSSSPGSARTFDRRRITLNMDRRACVALAVAGSSRDGKGQGA